MTTRACQTYEWCNGGSPTCNGDHSSVTYQPATLGAGAPYLLRDDHSQLMIGTGVRFNAADGEVAPRITVHIDGGPDNYDVQVDLRITEAYALSQLLDNALVDATKASVELLPPRLAADEFDPSGGVK